MGDWMNFAAGAAGGPDAKGTDWKPAPTSKKTGNFALDSVEQAIPGFNNLRQAMGDAGKSIGNFTGGFFQGVGDTLWGGVKGVGQWIGDTASGAFDTTGKLLQGDFLGALGSGLGTLGTGLSGFGYLAEGMVDGAGVQNQGVKDAAFVLGGFLGGGTVLKGVSKGVSKLGGALGKAAPKGASLPGVAAGGLDDAAASLGRQKGLPGPPGPGSLSKPPSGPSSPIGPSSPTVPFGSSPTRGLNSAPTKPIGPGRTGPGGNKGLGGPSGPGGGKGIGGAGGAAGGVGAAGRRGGSGKNGKGGRWRDRADDAMGMMASGFGGMASFYASDTLLDRSFLSSSSTRAASSPVSQRNSQGKRVDRMGTEGGEAGIGMEEKINLPRIPKSPVRVTMDRPSNL